MGIQQKTEKQFCIETFLINGFGDIAKNGWSNFQPFTIEDCPTYAKTKGDFLELFEDHISKQVSLSVLDIFDGSETPRERLFDILIERFDLMNKYKDGLNVIFSNIPTNPKTILKSTPSLRNLMIDLLDWSKMERNALLGEIKIIGMAYIYIKTCKTWLNDETPDLSKTMAELDKNLNFADQVANSLLNFKI